MNAAFGTKRDRSLRGVDAVVAPETAVSGERGRSLGHRYLTTGPTLGRQIGDELEGVAGGVEDQQSARIRDARSRSAADPLIERGQRPRADERGRSRRCAALSCENEIGRVDHPSENENDRDSKGSC